MVWALELEKGGGSRGPSFLKFVTFFFAKKALFRTVQSAVFSTMHSGKFCDLARINSQGQDKHKLITGYHKGSKGHHDGHNTHAP